MNCSISCTEEEIETEASYEVVRQGKEHVD